MTHGQPQVAIILLNWNQADFTVACLRSLQYLDYPAFDVYVVDNGSVDGSPAVIQHEFPGVVLINNNRNLGFAEGNNVGIRRALEQGADYVMLLNNDTEVTPDLLCQLVEVGEKDPTIGILGPKIYYYDESNVIWSAGACMDGYGRPRHLRENQIDDGSPEDQRDVDYVTGCAILVKRAVIHSVGVLDPRFFIYFEESEWCARARRAGFRVVYVPQGRMWHKIKMSVRNYSRRYLFLMSRNRLLYLRCSGAPLWAILVAVVDVLRLATVWSVRPKHRDKRPLADALVRGVGAFLLGRFGDAPARI